MVAREPGRLVREDAGLARSWRSAIALLNVGHVDLVSHSAGLAVCCDRQPNAPTLVSDEQTAGSIGRRTNH